jgi:hypothetical protein
MFAELLNDTLLQQSLGIIDGLFLLLLAISGNFIAETLGCQTQKLLTESIMAKQLMTFFIIFFTISYSNKDIDSPLSKLTKALLVYGFFLLFTKMNLTPTIIVLVLLVGIYIAGNYKNYYNALYNKKHSKNDIRPHQERIKQITKIQKITMIGIIAVIVSGFFIYYKEKKIEYDNSFDFTKFIFGVVKCKKLT